MFQPKQAILRENTNKSNILDIKLYYIIITYVQYPLQTK